MTPARLLGALVLIMLGAAGGHVAFAQPNADEIRDAIAAAPDSRAVGARLTQLAETLLASLDADGAATACLFGVPTLEQESRVRRVSAEALDAARRAVDSLDAALESLARDPEFAERRDLQNLRSELAVTHRLVRAPLARARAAALIAAVSIDAGDARVFAAEAAAALDEIEPIGPAVEAASLTLRFSNAGPVGAAPDRARRLAELVADNAARSALAESSRTLMREAVVAAHLASADAKDAEITGVLLDRTLGAENADALDGIAARDARALAALRTGADPAGAMRALAAGASRHDPALAALALAKIRRLLDSNADARSLPPAAWLAHSEQLAERGRGDAALDAFGRAWAALGGAKDVFTIRAGWGYAGALRARGGVNDVALAGRVLMALSEIEADDGRAAAAADSALALLAWAHSASRDDAAARESVRDVYRDALRAAINRDPRSRDADTRRLALADLTEGEARLALLDEIRPGSETYIRARLALAWIERDALRGASNEAAREARAFSMLDHAQRAATDAEQIGAHALTPTIEQARAVALAALRRFDDAATSALAWADADDRAAGPDAVEIVRRAASEAMREALTLGMADQARAIAPALERVAARALERIINSESSRSALDPAALDLADALRALGRAGELPDRLEAIADRFGLTRGVGLAIAEGLAAGAAAERAFSICRDVVDASRALDAEDEIFWRAWAVMLEILVAQNGDGSRTETIRRQAARLRASAPDLGAGPSRRRIEDAARGAR